MGIEINRNRPTADELMRQAPMTIKFYFLEAVEIIDKHFGEGYAKENPVLLAAFIQGCSEDLKSMVLMNKMETKRSNQRRN
jgi:hypothetical protein